MQFELKTGVAFVLMAALVSIGLTARSQTGFGCAIGAAIFFGGLFLMGLIIDVVNYLHPELKKTPTKEEPTPH